MHRLIVVKGIDPCAQIELVEGDERVLGREGDPPLFRDRKMSRRHARFASADGRCTVTDQGSRNGTKVNGRRINGPTHLRRGDRLRVGNTFLEYTDVPVDAGAPAGARGRDWLTDEKPRLRVIEGDERGEVYELPTSGQVMIGRSEGSLYFYDRQLSRRHASIRLGVDGCTLTDLGSKNGTLVNGQRISAPRRLKDGDRIRVGRTLLMLSLEPALDAVLIDDSSADSRHAAPDPRPRLAAVGSDEIDEIDLQELFE